MNTRKKLIAGLMAALIIGTIGAVFATAQTDVYNPRYHHAENVPEHPSPK